MRDVSIFVVLVIVFIFALVGSIEDYCFFLSSLQFLLVVLSLPRPLQHENISTPLYYLPAVLLSLLCPSSLFLSHFSSSSSSFSFSTHTQQTDSTIQHDSATVVARIHHQLGTHEHLGLLCLKHPHDSDQQDGPLPF